MKQQYLSLRWYFSLLFGLLILIGGGAFSIHALHSMEQQRIADAEHHHHAVYSHFQQLLGTATKKLSDMTVIFPLVPFSNVGEEEKGSLKAYEKVMRSVWEDIEIFWGIDQMFLVDKQGAIVMGTRKALLPNLRKWLEFSNVAQPQSRLFCLQGQECLLYYAMPIAGMSGLQGYLIFADSLHEVLQDLSRTQEAQVALIAKSPQSGNKTLLHQVGIHPHLMNWLEADNNLKSLSVDRVKRVKIGEHEYELGVKLVDPEKSGDLLLLWTRDVASQAAQVRGYLTQIFFIGGILILVAIWLSYLAISPVTNRLRQLSELLPKLAGASPEKMDSIINEMKVRSGVMPRTELDIVASASRKLMLRLAATAREVVQRTTELESMALTDALTALPNRNMMRHDLEMSLKDLDRTKELLGVCMLDVDDFKLVNDSLGHDEGDVLIQQLGQRLRGAIRECDSVFRLGGDEFVVIYRHLNDVADLYECLGRLLKTFQVPVMLSTRPFNAAVSIGVVVVDRYVMQEEILKQADMAMYKAKGTSGSCYELFDERLADEANQRLQVISAVPRALENNEFCLHLQPQMNLMTGRVVGFESLIRWNDSDKGLVYPDSFIPHLERSHYMIELGYWVLKASVEILSGFHRAGYKQVSIAVNLSPQQFSDSQLIPFIERLMAEQIFPAHCLHIEITESSVMRDIDNAVSIVSALRQIGVRVAMDDFGTGHSSLGHLQSLPLDILKIDRSFVSGILDSPLNRQIVKSVIEIASVLNMEVVAEGVEINDEEKILRELECETGQGYLYARPMSVEDAMEWLQRIETPNADLFSSK